MTNRKKITLAILIILTIVLAGVSIFVTIKLQQSQAPGTTGAYTGPGFTNACGTGYGTAPSSCNRGCSGTSCSGTWVVRFTCSGRQTECGGGGPSPIAESSGGSQGVSGQCGTTDQIDVFNKNCRASGGWSCGGGDLQDYIVYYNGDCQQATPKYKCSGSSCVRDDANGTTTDSNCNNSCSVAQSICGGSCNTSADCKVTQFGIQPTCSGGMCVNPVCPTDFNHDPQCACKTATSKCGDKCGIWSDGFHPLCGDGVSSCSWINGPTCGGNNLTYCMPFNPGSGYTSAACTNTSAASGYKYLIAPNGQPITTQAQILEACAQTPTTKKCYRCTAATTDGNTCENIDVASTTACPTGYTENSNCAAAVGGACPVSTTCGQSCDASHLCPTGHTCNGSVCKLDQCITNPSSCLPDACTPATQVACGAACDTTHLCPTNHTCSSGVCKLNSCIANPSSCLADSCTPTNQVACGASCDSTHICPTNHTCTSGVCKLNSCISNPSSCLPDACTPTTQVACGASCDSTHLCPTNHTCTAGVCKLNSCISNPSSCLPDACTPTNQVACGQACDSTHICAAQTHTCDAGICKLNTCLTPGNCSDNSCTPIVPVCGGSCTSNAQCPNDHSCVNNKCVLNGCTSSTCSNGCVPLCGGPCTTNNDCPSSHSCINGKCQLNGCTASTCLNGCSVIPVIPDTGIADDARLLVIGTIFIVGGYITLRLNNKQNLFASLWSDTSNSYEDKTEKELKKKAEK